jgi:hypothetical protein
MSRNRRLALAAAGVVVVVALLLVWWLRRPATAPGAAGPEAVPGGGGLSLAVDLYFPSSGFTLVRERRDLPAVEEPQARLEALARALAEGPTTPSLHAPLPPGVEVRLVHLAPDGTVYVDLASEEGAEPPPSGTTEELLRVYSLVNTLLLNVSEARSAVLLWNGVQRPTFSGHLDLTHPLLPDPSLVRREPAG